MTLKQVDLQNNIESDNIKLDWKRICKEVFVKLDIMNSDFTGKIIFNCNQGGIVDYEKTERIK